MGMEAVNPRSVYVRCGLKITDETPRIKDKNHWGIISRRVTGGKEKKIGKEKS